MNYFKGLFPRYIYNIMFVHRLLIFDYFLFLTLGPCVVYYTKDNVIFDVLR